MCGMWLLSTLCLTLLQEQERTTKYVLLFFKMVSDIEAAVWLVQKQQRVSDTLAAVKPRNQMQILSKHSCCCCCCCCCNWCHIVKCCTCYKNTFNILLSVIFKEILMQSAGWVTAHSGQNIIEITNGSAPYDITHAKDLCWNGNGNISITWITK